MHAVTCMSHFWSTYITPYHAQACIGRSMRDHRRMCVVLSITRWFSSSGPRCEPQYLRQEAQLAMAAAPPPRPVRVVAVVVWILSGKPDLGLCYVLSRRQRYDHGDVDFSEPATAALLLAAYMEDEAVQAQALLALGSLDNHHRIVADTFLIHSLLVEHVVQQSSRGITLGLEDAIATYIRLWACRPMSQEVERRLALLVWNRNARRRFGVNLRREWSLNVATFRTPRDLLPEEIRRRVGDTCFT